MLEVLLSSASKSQGPIPPGEVQWVAPGTYQWTCPLDVTEVCVVMIAAGEPSYLWAGGGNIGGGSGGGLRYRNEIPVVPRQVYTIVVGNPAGVKNSTAFDIDAGVYNQGTQIGNTVFGGWGGGKNSASDGGSGGNAGLYNGGQTQAGSVAKTGGRGAGLTGGLGLVSQGGKGGVFGGGGGGAANNAGGNGAVRIIWGDGRQFPDKAT